MMQIICASSFRVPRPAAPPPLTRRYIFEFIGDRAKEGLSQLENLAQKTSQGKLGEALTDVSDYTSRRQALDADNSAQLFAGLQSGVPRDRPFPLGTHMYGGRPPPQ